MDQEIREGDSFLSKDRIPDIVWNILIHDARKFDGDIRIWLDEIGIQWRRPGVEIPGCIQQFHES